jgi:hexosaminidase
MDLGARRLDLIGLKFELAQEIATVRTHRPLRSSTTRRAALPPTTCWSEISSMFGRCQDLRDAYSALKDEYSQVWLKENRPYWLNNVTVRYDLEIQKWQQRANQFEAGTRGWQNGQDLPSPRCPGIARAS